MDLKSLIPEAKRAAVDLALQTAFGTDTLEAIELLTGGMSSALVYKIVVQGKPYVLRLIMRIDPYNDPVRQYACMNIASAAGIAPHVHYSDSLDALAITDFIARSETIPTYGERLQLLAGTIRAIHATPLFPPLVNFLDGVDGFIQRFHASRMIPESATAEHWRYYAQIQSGYPRHDTDLVSSHNDLNPNNLIFDGSKLWVIDWEAAFCNDRYVDLATCGVFFVTDATGEEQYLAAYFGDTLDDYKRARYFVMQQVCRIYYGLAMLFIASLERTPDVVHDESMDTPSPQEFHAMLSEGKVSFATYEGKLLYGKVKLNTALAFMKTPRFAEAIHQMG